ncbi:DUF2752 domain-containing protein [Stackebrandtia soli]|uniref:DUF2752 domain-containing protein n=1 Tax=Stackebrandtia soli TaxID=1892856 RepID=UPI0039E950D4
MYDSSAAPTQEIPVVRNGPPTPAGRAANVPPIRAPHVAPGHVVDSDRTQEVPLVALRRPVRAPSGLVGKVWDRLRHSPAWLAPAALATCFAGAAAFVLATDPTDNVGPTTCAFKLVTGFDCPGCGGTRAFYYLLTLQLPEAAHNHAIAVFAAPFLLYLYARWSLRRVFPNVRWRLPRLRITPTLATNFLIVWAVFWVARNLPFAPFTSLFV